MKVSNASENLQIGIKRLIAEAEKTLCTLKIELKNVSSLNASFVKGICNFKIKMFPLSLFNILNRRFSFKH